MGGRNVDYSVLERILAGNEEPRHLPLEILISITDNFSEDRKVGSGRFGDVYKGVLHDRTVAVKKITVNSTNMDGEEKLFHREVQSLLRIIEHPNVVRFLGFCFHRRLEAKESTRAEKRHVVETRDRLLCFEYISNGSLENYITDELRGLEWNIRYQLIKGICDGLQNLHNEMGIIHMDLKPANILVDTDHMVPKITDFALARLVANNYTTGVPFFSRGYCAPEYMKIENPTFECDIYSLGIIIREIVTGRNDEMPIRDVIRRWRHRWRKLATYTPLHVQQITKCVEIAERCTQEDPKRRPSISHIIRDLNESANTNVYIPEKKHKYVGIEGPRDTLVKKLIGGDDVSKKKLKIISIFGEGGLGKTTLAKMVFDKLAANFVLKAFVPVGRNPDIKRVLEDILFELDKKGNKDIHNSKKNERQLIDLVRKLLENKRYFIIIDDIWDIKSWEIIECALIDNGNGSRVMTTSRINDVTKSSGECCKLEPLSYDQSKQLFYSRLTCKSTSTSDQSDEQSTKYILEKCGGVPLAIITVASLLDGKRVEDWPKVYNSIIGHDDNRVAWDYDDMLGIEPLELRFAFELLNKEISKEVVLTNETGNYIAFNIKTRLQYRTQPNKGIVLPGSKRIVNITLQAQGTTTLGFMTRTGEFIVQSTKVVDSLTDEEITHDMFDEEDGRVVDEVHLTVVYDDGPEKQQADKSQYTSTTARILTFQLLSDITKGFSCEHKIGHGSFGEVYKGELPNGEKIAVKKLRENLMLVNDMQFKNEVLILENLKHHNIVQFVGYCHETQLVPVEFNGKVILAERQQRTLCFEYLQNGSLKTHLSEVSRGLNWETRYKIIKGICEGLNYLHNGSEDGRPIYHMDLKPDNILLDENMVPKIADFGLSRLFSTTQSQTTKTSAGTLGYMPPEYIDIYKISNKFDVFSLGYIIIDIMIGPSSRRHEYDEASCDKDYSNLVQENWNKRLKATPSYTSQQTDDSLKVKTCIEMALKCVKKDRVERPTISMIVDTLKYIHNAPRSLLVDQARLVKFGLWGGKPGRRRDIKTAPHRLESVTIYSLDVIDALEFSYTDCNAQHYTAGPWGGAGGSPNKVQLRPSEVLVELCGTVGPTDGIPNVITSLILVTDADRYGPFGREDGTPFRICMQNNGHIVGFFARADKYVKAVGVYTNQEESRVGVCKVGPWGGEGGSTCDIDVPPHRVHSVTVRCSGHVIHSLAFSYSDSNGQHHTAGPWGGTSGEEHKIDLEPYEFLVKVSGTIGEFGGIHNLITSLTMVTNVATYGPFGEVRGTHFDIPVHSKSCIVGFFARAGIFVNAIGVYARPI